MYALDADDSQDWINRLMIAFDGQGPGLRPRCDESSNSIDTRPPRLRRRDNRRRAGKYGH